MSTIIKYDEIDINKMNYTKPDYWSIFFWIYKLWRRTKPLYIQTPKIKSLTNIKEISDKKAPYLEIEIPSNKLDLYDLFLSLDDKNIKTYC